MRNELSPRLLNSGGTRPTADNSGGLSNFSDTAGAHLHQAEIEPIHPFFLVGGERIVCFYLGGNYLFVAAVGTRRIPPRREITRAFKESSRRAPDSQRVRRIVFIQFSESQRFPAMNVDDCVLAFLMKVFRNEH